MTDQSSGAADDREVGSLAEEAAKLLGVLSGWAGEHAPDLDDVVERAGVVGQDLHDHLATGDPECTYCPICQGVRLLRGTSPEVRAHLGSAGASLAHALTALLSAAQAAQDGPDPSGTGVEHIPVEDDWPEEQP